MALYAKDAAVERMAMRLAVIRQVSVTEVVRQALSHELERIEETPSLVEQGIAFVRALHVRAQSERRQPADKAFVDGLYGHP